MQEKHLFEYAVIRVVPRVEREEFINVGVILYCHSQKFLKVLYQLNEQKILAISKETDVAELNTYLQALEKICIGGRDAGTSSAQESAPSPHCEKTCHARCGQCCWQRWQG